MRARLVIRWPGVLFALALLSLPTIVAVPYGYSAYGVGAYSPADSASRSGGGGYSVPEEERPKEDERVPKKEERAAPPVRESPRQITPEATTTDAVLLRTVEQRIEELKQEGFSVAGLKSYPRDVRNALAADDQERAAQLVQEVSAARDDAREARSIVAEMDALLRDERQQDGGLLTGQAVSLLTGNAIFPKAKGLTLTNTLMDRAQAAIESGDFATGLVLARQAQASYVIEQRSRGSLLGILQDYGLLMVVGICCFALLGFTVRVTTARSQAKDDARLSGWAAYADDAPPKDARSARWTEFEER